MASKPSEDDRAERGKRLALTRSNARLAATQALYQWEATGAKPAAVIKEFTDFRLGEVVDDVALPPADLKLFTLVVTGAAANVEELDDMIAAVLTEDWTVERLEATLRAILRCGVFELAHREDVPPRVVIAEYVGVCDAFFGAKETGLVNGILDQLARQLRPDEMGAGGGSTAR
ncbi:MAG TPA: transcription antitermination factor NusB [Dongiaceae bacterium]|nr:transcription antitermination factor NusB [Dongiaceae bacterium]